jgi:hypothetical protein
MTNNPQTPDLTITPKQLLKLGYRFNAGRKRSPKELLRSIGLPKIGNFGLDEASKLSRRTRKL